MPLPTLQAEPDRGGRCAVVLERPGLCDLQLIRVFINFSLQGKVRSEVTPFQCCSESSLVTCLSNLREHFENISILGMLSAVRRAAYTETGL